MHVLAEFSLVADVVVDVNALAIADFGQLGVNVEHETTEFANVNTTSFCELMIKVGDKCPPDNQHLQSINTS